MQRLKMVLSVVFASLIVLAGVPTPASAQTRLQPLQPVTSMRYQYVSTINEVPEIVCQGEVVFSSGAAYHEVCRDLVDAQYPEEGVEYVAGRVREFVFFGGVFYERTNGATTWTGTPEPNYDPNTPITEFWFTSYVNPVDVVITNLGEARVGAVPTTQYQFWSLDPELNAAVGGQHVYNAFVSAEGYVLKDQASYRGSFEKAGVGTVEGTVERIWTYTEFNSPAITVAPPPAGAVQMQPAAQSR